MQAVYGKEACKNNNIPCWSEVADKPHYLMSAQQGVNECGIYCLKFACMYDGDRCVEHIKNYDVCPCRLPSFCFMKRKIFSSYLFFLPLIVLTFFLSQDRSEDWKAEYMFRVLFHEDNKVPLEDLPKGIQCLSPTSTLSTQGEELLLMLTQLPAE